MRLMNSSAETLIREKTFSKDARNVVLIIALTKGGKNVEKTSSDIETQDITRLWPCFNDWDTGNSFSKRKMKKFREISGFGEAFGAAARLHQSCRAEVDVDEDEIIKNLLEEAGCPDEPVKLFDSFHENDWHPEKTPNDTVDFIISTVDTKFSPQQNRDEYIFGCLKEYTETLVDMETCVGEDEEQEDDRYTENDTISQDLTTAFVLGKPAYFRERSTDAAIHDHNLDHDLDELLEARPLQNKTKNSKTIAKDYHLQVERQAVPDAEVEMAYDMLLDDKFNTRQDQDRMEMDLQFEGTFGDLEFIDSPR